MARIVSRVCVDLGRRSYEIRIGSGLLECVGPWLAASGRPSRAAVITHPLLSRRYGAPLARGLRAAGIPWFKIEVPAGERQKSLRRAGALAGELLARGCDRRSVVIALGGGVIGDLAGFVAATFMRGIGYAQVPTTLLAQVDASVGGKVAVDHPLGKNMIGAFHQPRLVVADLDTLVTLPARELRCGLAEVVKCGVIADAGLFAYLEAHVERLLALDRGALAHAVRRSVEIKAEIVGRDEREAGLRAILNFGHTLGHALETHLGYRRLRHGEAISIGMAAAARLGVRLCGLSEGAAERLEALLAAFGLPTRLPRGVAGADLVAAMRRDKKTVVGRLRLVVPRRIGRVAVVEGVPVSEVRRALREVEG